ncbi:O-antigen ligase family protein [Hyalangium rubrum]|uniref:O-antigen ligase family protein n=1 Tax=Hyalangium rubrum TaxID=3103134 RepID=A0ABU5H0V5_9BACT|nr:O-antigen ligase family protein [Hyalangium sp. s54d21]MDY7226936.1 O-antigen ligase family protein [Hyalangium sp. s54d21]
MPSSRRTSRFSIAAEAVLAGLVVSGPLALGGAATWALWPLVGLSALAAVLAAEAARRQGHSLHVPLLAVPLVASAVLCLLQLIPLPPALLAVVSPEAAALREFALVPLGLSSARPVSLDPPATWRELAKHLAYVLAFLSAVEVCRSRRSRQRLLSTLAFTGAAVTLLGLLHSLLGLTELVGLRSYTHARPPLVTPFGNPNHLAGFLTLSATVGLGLMLSSARRERTVLFAVAALLSGAGVLLSLSRAGILFFLFGQGVLAVWLLRRRAKRRDEEEEERVPSPWSRGPLALLVLGATLAVGGYVAWEKLVAEAASVDSVEKLRHSKVDLWPMMAEAARSFPVLGMGRGAFEAAFPRYQTALNPNTLTHPENAVLQLGAEFGVLGLVLLAVGIWGFTRLMRGARLGRLELAVLAAVLALGLHNLFDFSLELPACAVAAWVALATVARPEEREASGSPRWTWRLPATRGMGMAAVVAVVALVALVPGRHTLMAAEAELAGLVHARAPLAEVRGRALGLIDRHPSDYLLYGLVGSAYATGGQANAGEALAFINRALYLRPTDTASHRIAARALLALGRRGQAFLEYRFAHESGDESVLVREALEQTRTVEELRALTPDSATVVAQLALALASRPGRQEQALDWLAWARERFDAAPGVFALWELEARMRVGRGELGVAEALCAEIELRAPAAPQPVLLRAEILRAQGRREDAIQLLEQSLPRFPGNLEMSFALASQLLDTGLTRRAREVLNQSSRFVTDYRQRARLLALEGACFERDGLLGRALERYVTVSRLEPAPEAHFQVARLQEALRRPGDAARAVRKGLQLQPEGSRSAGEAWLERLEAEEKRLLEAHRQQLMEDPGKQDVEQLLRTRSESP